MGELKKVLGLIDVAMLGAGAAMGVSVFSVLGPAAKVGGAGMLVTLLIAAAPMLVFALVYAFMASTLPKSGASFEWPRLLIHPFAGFLVAWLRILASVGALVTLSLVFVQYLSMVVAVPARPAMFLLLLAIYLLNVRGIEVAARLQTLAMFLLLATLSLFVVAGLHQFRLAAIGDPLGAGMMPILVATPLMISLFLGIETATEVGEEVRDPRRTIPRALAVALLLTVMVYLMIAATALGLLGPARLAASPAPILEASRLCLGPLASPLVLIAAILALLKSLNAVFLVFSRYLFAMARAGALPGAMARVHPRWGTPHVAASAAFGCATAGLALPKDLLFLLVAISIPTVLKYLSTCVSAIQLVRTRSNLMVTSPLGMSPRTVLVLAAAGVTCALALFVTGFQTDWRPYALICGWAAVGTVFWLLRARKAIPVSESPRLASHSCRHRRHHRPRSGELLGRKGAAESSLPEDRVAGVSATPLALSWQPGEQEPSNKHVMPNAIDN